MKLCVAVLLASLSALAVSPAIAGTQSGFVKSLYVRDSDGVILVDLTGTGTLHPACALQTYWVLNETSQNAQRLFSMLLTAQTTGHVVTIVGKDTCNRWPDGEDIDTVGVNGTSPPP